VGANPLGALTTRPPCGCVVRSVTFIGVMMTVLQQACAFTIACQKSYAACAKNIVVIGINCQGCALSMQLRIEYADV
jgi:hypothetical protein